MDLLRCRLFEEPIIGHLKSKMAEIHHLENRHDVIFFCWEWSDLDKISQTGAKWHVDCSDMVKIETRCRIPIWGRFDEFSGMSFQSHLPHCRMLPPGKLNVVIPVLRVTLQGAATGRIQWHVIPEPRMTLQGDATWWIHCHDSRATCHIAGCSHLHGEINVTIVPHCRV